MTVSLVDWLAANGRDFTQIRLESFLDRQGVLDALEVSARTFRRWEQQQSYPRWAVKVVAVEAGYLVRDGWQGWQVGRDGLLYSPELRDGFAPQDIISIAYLQQRCAELERRNAAPAQYLLDC